jgi:hypothetical protein
MDGAAVAAALATLYPDTIPTLRQYMGLPAVMVNGWLRSQPIIAPLMEDPHFPEFFVRFKAAIEGNLDDEDDYESGEEDTAPAGADAI